MTTVDYLSVAEGLADSFAKVFDLEGLAEYIRECDEEGSELWDEDIQSFDLVSVFTRNLGFEDAPFWAAAELEGSVIRTQGSRIAAVKSDETGVYLALGQAYDDASLVDLEPWELIFDPDDPIDFDDVRDALRIQVNHFLDDWAEDYDPVWSALYASLREFEDFADNDTSAWPEYVRLFTPTGDILELEASLDETGICVSSSHLADGAAFFYTVMCEDSFFFEDLLGHLTSLVTPSFESEKAAIRFAEGTECCLDVECLNDIEEKSPGVFQFTSPTSFVDSLFSNPEAKGTLRVIENILGEPCWSGSIFRKAFIEGSKFLDLLEGLSVTNSHAFLPDGTQVSLTQAVVFVQDTLNKHNHN